MSARLDAVWRELACLDPLDQQHVATGLIGEMVPDQLEPVLVAVVNRLEVIGKTDPSAADRLAQAVMSTFVGWRSNMSGSLTDAIDREVES